MKLSDLRIRTKLFLLIGLMAAVILAVAAVGVVRLVDLNAHLGKVDSLSNVQVLSAQMNQILVGLSRNEYRAAAEPSPNTLRTVAEGIVTGRKQFLDRLAQVRAGAGSEAAAMVTDVQTLFDIYATAADGVVALAQNPPDNADIAELQAQFNQKARFNKTTLDKIQMALRNFGDGLDKQADAVVEDAKASGRAAITLMLAVAGIGAVAGVAFGALLATFGIARPLNRSVDQLSRLADGDLEVAVTGAERRDECGAVAKGLAVFRDHALRARALEVDAEALRQQADEERHMTMHALAEDFERVVGGIAALVATAATEMQATASQLTGSAQATSTQSTVVSGAAERASSNVAAVASAAEQLGASVDEIARQVARSSRMSQEAVVEAENSAGLVAELNGFAAGIGDVVDTITMLAGQTNLLALNATIEAARAGEAGRGFAVVAAEVKELANQTARATTEITAKIAAIQASTGRASGAINGISGTIRSINQVASAISAAVEQQGAATREIVTSIGQASGGASEVTGNISGVARAAEETGAAAAQVLNAATEMARQAALLRLEMGKFVTTVRAA